MPSKAMTDWEACYQEGNTPWDKGHPAPLLDELARNRPDIFKGRVLVPGCGLGHDARWLVEQDCEVTGLDIAPSAVARAKEHDPSGRVRFVQGNLFDLPADLRGAFDMVWEHTCLSAMPPELRPSYAAGMVSALKPGGCIVGVFYMNPDMDPGEMGPPFGLSVDELIAMWAAVGMVPEEHWVPNVAYEGREGRERFMILKPDPQTSQIPDQTAA